LLEKVIIFIIFLCPLVFFHELGHFLFARLFGVRVEVFSLGFGPKLFRYKKGDTEYTLSLIPMGGYVKMFGDDPLNKDAIPENERKYSFTFKNKWQRFWIVFGGPLANFILAYFIFFTLMLVGEKLPEVKLGFVPKSSVMYEYGFRTGDVLNKVNGKQVYNPADIALDGSSHIESATVLQSNGEVKKLYFKISGQDFFKNFMKHPPLLRKSIVVNKKGERFFLHASSFKKSIDFPFDSFADLKGENMFSVYKLKAEDLPSNVKDLEDPLESFSLRYDSQDDFYGSLFKKGYFPVDLVVKSVSMNSAADKAKIKGSDIIVAIDGNSIVSFDELRKSLQKTDSDVVRLTIWRSGEKLDVEVRPEIKRVQGKDTRLIGVYTAGLFHQIKFIKTASKGLFGSAFIALPRTWDTMVKTVEGFKKLITQEVSLKSVGGPIAISKVAADSFNTSLSYFFQIMALISINLGIINLFPIPVLDGGHIMFILLEIVNRGPLSRRKMEIAQQFGLSLLLLLTFVALFNDFSKMF
jgi:regulator of sigma E protease